MTARFEAWGYSATFAVIVGVAESLGGLMVLIPGLALYGATIIAVDMTGAVYTHVATGIGSPVSALAYLAIGAALGWLRRRDAWAPSMTSGPVNVSSADVPSPWKGPAGESDWVCANRVGCAQIASDTWQLTDVERSGRVTLAVSQEVLRHDHALYRHVFHARECRAFSNCKTVLAIEGLRIHGRTQMKIPQATVTRYLLSCLQ